MREGEREREDLKEEKRNVRVDNGVRFLVQFFQRVLLHSFDLVEACRRQWGIFFIIIQSAGQPKGPNALTGRSRTPCI